MLVRGLTWIEHPSVRAGDGVDDKLLMAVYVFHLPSDIAKRSLAQDDIVACRRIRDAIRGGRVVKRVFLNGYAVGDGHFFCVGKVCARIAANRIDAALHFDHFDAASVICPWRVIGMSEGRDARAASR